MGFLTTKSPTEQDVSDRRKDSQLRVPNMASH